MIEQPKEYRFLADPFYHPKDGILVEALRKSTGLGEIVHLSPAGASVISDNKGHYSYPATFAHDSEHYVLPEMSEWSVPKLFRLGESRLEEIGPLDVPNSPRLLDPTLHSEGGKIYLFANCAAEGSSVLRLWVSDTLPGPFREHPASPICVSPAGARMAGAVRSARGMQLRVGQDNRRDYGDGLVLFRIERLTPGDYQETRLGELRFGHFRGPHTLNFKDGRMVFDFYADRVSPLAGARRVRSLLSRRSQNNG
jgi:hypothetical protein